MSQKKVAFVFSGQISFFLILFLIFFLSVPITGLVWDFANALGYVAVGCFLLLFIFTGQQKEYPAFKGHFFTRFHKEMGYGAFLFTLLHVAILLIQEPLLIEHLKLSAPWYMLSGLMALVMALLLVLSSLSRIRSRIWDSYRIFRFVHKWSSICIILLIGFHIVGSGYYINNLTKEIFSTILFSGVMLYYLYNQKIKIINIQTKLNVKKFTSTWILISTLILLIVLSLFLMLIKHEYFINVTP